MPENLQELQQSCQQITGLTIAAAAERLRLTVPPDLHSAKGWLGQLIERFLGASGGSHAQHDFPQLNIELKTIPIDSSGRPLETTYVCTVQSNESSLNWQDSWVYRKLCQVLWVPIVSDVPLGERIIQKPILWRMDSASEEILRQDWEELMELLQLGYGKNLSAKFGRYLHIRPKAAHSKIITDYVDAEGHATKIVPKGFYLRTEFTKAILVSS